MKEEKICQCVSTKFQQFQQNNLTKMYWKYIRNDLKRHLLLSKCTRHFPTITFLQSDVLFILIFKWVWTKASAKLIKENVTDVHVIFSWKYS